MRFLSLFATIVVFTLSSFVLAAPRCDSKGVKKYSGLKNGGYIVKLKPGVSKKELAKKVKLPAKTTDYSLINGFCAANLDKATLDALTRAEEVDYIAEDGYAHEAATLTQYNASWNLYRIGQPATLDFPNPFSFGYSFQYDSSAGTGVDIYIVDTGIYTGHVDFGGRATWGGTFGVSGDTDEDGHGTHVAGTAGGFTFGVAKNASLIAVKVLDDESFGPISGIIEGLDWVRAQADVSGRPSVVSMSLAANGTSDAFDEAVENLVAAGVHVVVAAGNSNQDASNWSPARVPEAITVGATDAGDNKALFSNYGSVIDIHAPGVIIPSAGTAYSTAIVQMSGTSMACPHVSGLVAYLISKEGNLSPAEMESRIQSLAASGWISGLPTGTVNLMAQVPI